MLAQTLAYGLFAARIMDLSPGFTRQEAQGLIPKTNPFLRDFFYQVTGPQMDDEPFAGFVDDLAALLADRGYARDSGRFRGRTGQEDPVMHFYETFLAAYDPKLRETRGVYFTPSPVPHTSSARWTPCCGHASSVRQGLADHTQVEIDNPAPAPPGKGGAKPPKKIKIHKVLLLDPATGTATFPYAVIDHIRAGFMQSGNAGLWSSYVREHLLPRLFGFELLMAPYAVAHFKLGLQLAALDLPEAQRKAWAYDFQGDERVGVFLTNTLEGPHEHTGLPLFTQFLARETDAADRIKHDLPVLVIFGNPPYSNFGRLNRNPWILGLLDDYKRGLNERKLNLDDDFVKFIRFGQWRIERTDCGILAYITNNTYLDGVTHRRMRQSLMDTFSDIFVLNLHGSIRRGETCPDGTKDENVFDIQQGVAIGIFVKEPGKTGPANVHYADLWGTRQDKYTALSEMDLSTTPWIELQPKSPYFLFVPRDESQEADYHGYEPLSEAFLVSGNGIGTDRDDLFYDHDRLLLSQRIMSFYSDEGLQQPFRELYHVQNSSGYPLLARRLATSYDDAHIQQCTYRPFDRRWLYYDPKLTSRPAFEVMKHLAGENLALLVTRQVSTGCFQHVFVANGLVDRDPLSLATRERTQIFPLYLDPTPTNKTSKQRALIDTFPWPPDAHGRVPNLAPAFVAEVEARLGLKFAPSQTFEVSETSKVSPEVFTPEDLFHYIYAIFHAPAYRSRYAEFLKMDFPRVPITSDPALFRQLAALGRELVALHLLDADAAPALLKPITRYPVGGDSTVEKGHPRYDEAQRRVYISKDNVQTGKQGQYFEGVPPEVWDFQVGGYQPCQKWLKDRVGRQLTYDDLTHYQRIVVALNETIRLMAEIDAAIPAWPVC